MIKDFEEIFQNLVELEIFKAFERKNDEDTRIMKAVYEKLKLKEFKKGEVIIKEGDVGENFYILMNGAVQVLRTTHSGDPIALANLNDKMHVFFGEAALIGNDTRSATVRATSDCQTLTLSGKDFISICEQEPIFGYKVLLCLARRLKTSIAKANNDIATLYEALFREIEGGN